MQNVKLKWWIEYFEKTIPKHGLLRPWRKSRLIKTGHKKHLDSELKPWCFILTNPYWRSDAHVMNHVQFYFISSARLSRNWTILATATSWIKSKNQQTVLMSGREICAHDTCVESDSEHILLVTCPY